MTRRRSRSPRRGGASRRHTGRRWVAIGGLLLIVGLAVGAGF